MARMRGAWRLRGQSATAASSAAGLNGFCRLETAPSLVAMVRKSGRGAFIRIDRPPGDHDDRDQRPQMMNHPHGLEPVHSRHEDIEKQQVEIAGFELREALAAVAGGDHAMASAFEQQANGGLDRRIVIHDQYSCQNTPLRARAGIRSTAGCEFCRNPVLLQRFPRPGRSAGGYATLVNKHYIRPLSGRRPPEWGAPTACDSLRMQGTRGAQSVRYSGYRARIRASSLIVPDRWVRKCFWASSGSPAPIALAISL